MPTPVMPEPTQHRELGARQHLGCERALQLARRRDVTLEVALELGVVAGHDLLDDLVVDVVLAVGDVVGQWLGVVPGGVVLDRLLGQHVGQPVERLGLAERQLERRDAVTERLAAAARRRRRSRRGACPRG